MDSSLYKKITKQKRLYEEVIYQITDVILSNHLQPGDKLPTETELTRKLGVGRSALREAIKALEQKGLIEVKHGSGMYVRSIFSEPIAESIAFLVKTDASRYFELTQVRDMLDTEIVGRVAESATDEDIAILREKLERMHQVCDSPREFARADVEFHMATYGALKNGVLMTIMKPIMEVLADEMALTFEAPGSAESSLRRHEDLVEQICARDAQGARRVMREILLRGEERIREAQRAKRTENEFKGK